ncbi:MAG: RimK family alpha-L-glutamate ligase [Candidatus Rokuibacteriota bacterium]
MTHVCFVTCRRWPEISESDRLVARALEERGTRVEGRAWNEPSAGFEGFDAVVLRSNWDYHFDPPAFLAWLDRLERAGARVFNPPALVRWNVSKRYLMALQAAGVPVVATAGLEDETRAGLEAIMRDHGWRACVLKPEIGASAHDTRLVTEDTLAETAAAIAAGAIRRPVLVQPFVEEVRTRGEWSLIFIEGSLTHSVLKMPAAGDFRVQSHLGGTVRAEPAPPAVVRAAGAALAALPEAPLYARIDAVDTPGGALIMEVEVNEPSLFFTHAPPAAALRFAEALLARISGTATAVGTPRD